MAKTIEIYKLNSISILDSISRIRNSFLDKWFHNNIDATRFYLFIGKLSKIPIIGIPLKSTLHLYYRYFHTNSLIFPMKDIEEIIHNSTHLYVDPCPCRLLAGDAGCGAQLYGCIRINNAAKLRMEEKNSRGLSKTDAIALIRNARAHGLVFSLESCVQPYQYNICLCCKDCCVPLKMRYEFKLDIYNSGPYLPVFENEKCNDCQICVNKCPVNALSEHNNKLELNRDRCLGCGICAEVCDKKAITMVIHQDRVRRDSEPGPLRMFFSLLYIYTSMMPMVMLYRLINGSMQERVLNAGPNKNDVFHDNMQ
jgi:Pyruvate/2-oxoacid:ferredoxin oxidoreductase delta subunit